MTKDRSSVVSAPGLLNDIPLSHYAVHQQLFFLVYLHNY